MQKEIRYKGYRIKVGADNPQGNTGGTWMPSIEINGVRQIPALTEEHRAHLQEGFTSAEVALIFANDVARQLIDADAFMKRSKA